MLTQFLVVLYVSCYSLSLRCVLPHKLTKQHRNQAKERLVIVRVALDCLSSILLFEEVYTSHNSMLLLLLLDLLFFFFAILILCSLYVCYVIGCYGMISSSYIYFNKLDPLWTHHLVFLFAF